MVATMQSRPRETAASFKRRSIVLWSLCSPILVRAFLISAWAITGHNALLPQPQQIHYGARQLRIRGLAIQLIGEPSVEDRFAAEQLSSCLSDLAKEPVRVSLGEASGRLIVLTRTGEVSALPLPGEHPGPESREAYTLKVTADGGTVQAASTAGLFYAVQTRRPSQRLKFTTGHRSRTGEP
jgi:hypothetical protein